MKEDARWIMTGDTEGCMAFGAYIWVGGHMGRWTFRISRGKR